MINIPCRATFSNCHLVDILEKEKIFAAVTSQYVPVCTKGDGNYMYNMLSLSLSGTEQYMWHLRLLTAYSIIVHQERMINVIQPVAGIHIPPGEREPLQLLKQQRDNGWKSFAVQSTIKHGVTNFICMP